MARRDKTPVDLTITPRDRRFGRALAQKRWWLGGDPIGSAYHNALSITFPRGEAFFVESVKASYPYYYVRLLGGVLYLGGMLIMAWNVAMTVLGSKPVDAPVLAAPAHA